MLWCAAGVLSSALGARWSSGTVINVRSPLTPYFSFRVRPHTDLDGFDATAAADAPQSSPFRTAILGCPIAPDVVIFMAQWIVHGEVV